MFTDSTFGEIKLTYVVTKLVILNNGEVRKMCFYVVLRIIHSSATWRHVLELARTICLLCKLNFC